MSMEQEIRQFYEDSFHGLAEQDKESKILMAVQNLNDYLETSEPM
jgi:hypothetical protein